MKKKHIIFISIIALIILSGIIAYVFKYNKDSAFNKSKSIALYTVPAKEKIFVNGVIVPEKKENIYLDDTKGSVNKVSVTDGQVVKKGADLFTYKNDQITDQIDLANQQLTISNNQKKKLLGKQQIVKAGVDSSSISASPIVSTEAQISSYQDQIDVVQTQINNSKRQLENLKAKEFTYIIAPIDGKVVLNDPKDKTKPYIVIESTTYYVKGSISEKDQPKIKENQQVDILIFATNKTITGKIKSVGNSPAVADVAIGAAGTQTAAGAGSAISYYDSNISLDSQENVVNGFHVQAIVKLKGSEMKIPKSSILEETGKQYVFKVVNKKLTKTAITYENSTASQVIVLSGLNEKDRITVNTKDIKEGTSVE